MRTGCIVRKLFAQCLDFAHAKRFAAVMAAVEGLLACRRLSVTSIGRAMGSRRGTKHAIKRVDRLVGNPLLYCEIGGCVLFVGPQSLDE